MLKEVLQNFHPDRNGTVQSMASLFQKLAPHFLYGGYFQVGDNCRLYIRSVEFYFFDENKDETSPLNDEGMYHRNRKGFPIVMETGEVPYFPLMSLHAHMSGYDITFENESEKYRASALIRKFVVRFAGDNYTQDYIIRTKCGRQSFEVPSKDTPFDIRSTHVYSILNGFGTDGTSQIKWIDLPDYVPTPEQLNLEPLKRINFGEKEWRFDYI